MNEKGDMLGQQILQADNRASLLARFHYIIHCLARVVGARWCEMSSKVLIEVKSIRRLLRNKIKSSKHRFRPCG
mgnify:CR=1 FL=1